LLISVLRNWLFQYTATSDVYDGNRSHGQGRSQLFGASRRREPLSSQREVFSIDFLAAPSMPPLGPCVDLLGDGSFWAISAPGHTDDDMAFLINRASPVLLTGDASHFAWAFKTGVGPRGWNDAGTARDRVSLERGGGGPIGNELAKILAVRNSPFRLVGQTETSWAGRHCSQQTLPIREQTIGHSPGATVMPCSPVSNITLGFGRNELRRTVIVER
jgi:hypothetical protein